MLQTSIMAKIFCFNVIIPKKLNMLKIGDNISHYKIISAIGKGGMGEVFLAQDTKLDRKVALKILPSEFAEDKDRMSRFSA